MSVENILKVAAEKFPGGVSYSNFPDLEREVYLLIAKDIEEQGLAECQHRYGYIAGQKKIVDVLITDFGESD